MGDVGMVGSRNDEVPGVMGGESPISDGKRACWLALVDDENRRPFDEACSMSLSSHWILGVSSVFRWLVLVSKNIPPDGAFPALGC